jgi:hemerythrin-like domain-containing protein
MTRTASLRAQHDAAEAIIDEIFADLSRYRSSADAHILSLKLGRLANTLRSHFAAEDAQLYPSMIESRHREAALVARVFRDEVGHLSARFERFVERWSSSEAIAGALRQFRFEAGMLLSAIRDRIHRENRDLLPLAEEAVARKATLAARRSLSPAISAA